MMRSILFLILGVSSVFAQAGEKWVASWAGSVQGPYPSGNASAQPNLRFAFPDAAAGARDQSFRLIVQPDLWGRQARLRFSNVFGSRPVTFDGVFAGLHLGGGAVVKGTNRPVHFGGKASVTVPAGAAVWSDPVELTSVKNRDAAELAGRKLAVSFHVAGESGPMTWHAKALTTSYLSRPGAGAKGQAEDESAFPFTTTSWYFLDARGHEGAGRHSRGGGFRRFHHRRHSIHAERRRPVAECLVAAAACRVREPCLGGERGHRRESGGGPGGVLGGTAVLGRAIGEAAVGARRYSGSPASPP